MFKNLRSKIIIVAISILFLGIGASTFVTASLFRGYYTKAIQEKTLAIGENFKALLETIINLNIPIDQIAGFDEECLKVIKQNPDRAYVMVIDTEGKVLYHNDPNQRGKKLQNAADIKASTTTTNLIQPYRLEDKNHYDFTLPVFDAEQKHVGAIRIGFPVTLITQKIQSIVFFASLIGLVSFVLAVVILMFVLNFWVTRPLIQVVERIKEIAKGGGDLTKKLIVASQDELGELAQGFNSFIDTLHSMISQVRGAAEKLASASQQLSSSTQEINASNQEVATAIQQVTKGATTQADRVEETFELMEKSSIALNQVLSNAQSTSTVVSQTNTRAESGRITAEGTVEKIGQLATTVMETVKIIQGLGEKSQQIGEIIETITSIADQTNLLALNAAIEAARAGEAGRGFAVVAEEVRKLAEGSAEAVRKIGSLVRSIQGETKRAVDSIETSSKDVQEGRTQVAKIAEILIEISKSAQEAAKRTNEITAATAEQVKGAEHVVSAINEVAAIAKESVSTAEEVSSSTEEQTASMEEIAASAQELTRLAMDLKDVVGRFKTEEKEAGHPAKTK
jgi:methyl-accepting chemotaxis protein